MNTTGIPFIKAVLLALLFFAREIGAQPYGLETRTPIQPFLDGRMPPEQPEAGKYVVEPAFPNLAFQNPAGLVAVPGSNRLCVHTREGRIYTFANDPDTREMESFFDLSAQTQGWDDCGLLGVAFHPEYGQAGSLHRGDVYVFYQFSGSPTAGPARPPEKTPGYNRLSRFIVPEGARAADPNSELILIDQYDRSVWHNGGAMFFHPDDGFLYLTVGDEGGADGEFGNAQRLDRGLFSGVIRIDVNQNPARSHPILRQPASIAPNVSRTAHYFIPNDNPFQDASGSVLEEFWCIGLRSPHRMTYDPVSKTIWLADVGQELREEVNILVKGGNYQWAFKEGNLNGPFPEPAVLIGKEVAPVHEYSHSRGESRLDGDNCVIGGYVYRGREHADELEGKYIFGDNGSGRIWALTRESDGSVSVDQIATMPAGFGYSGLSSFGIDHAGELYLCQMGLAGRIFKLTRPKPSIPPPPLLSQTGAFVDLASMRTVPGLIPYTVNSPLWSDAAAKTRWMAVPNDGAPFGAGEQIAFARDGEWVFPLGTVFVKHFDLAIDELNSARTRRLETRFLVRDVKGAVYGVTYKWRPDNSDADLLPGSLSEHLSISKTEPVALFSNSQDVGDPSIAGSMTGNPFDGSYALASADSEIGGASDHFHFASQILRGDFDIKVRIESLDPAEGAAMAGLMIRESPAAESRYLLVSVSRSGSPAIGRYAVSVREGAGGFAETIVGEPGLVPKPPDAWLRLQRGGAQFKAYVGEDGIRWTQLDSRNLSFAEAVYFGMAMAAPGTENLARARFRDFGNNRAQTWYYPSPRDCLTCHTPFAGHVLGVKTHQLNGAYTYATTGRTDNQLRAWNHVGLFQPAPDETQIPAMPKLVAVTDSAAPLERRVRSYLAANCAQCHRPGGVRANFDARYETPLPQQGLINGALFQPFDIAGARVISPADPSKSALFLRLSALGENQMPPLARNTIDNAAVAAVAAWINNLPPVEITRGLRAEYYDNIDFTNLKLIRADPTVNFDWGQASPDPSLEADTFSARWSGEVEPTFSETYTFYTVSDDGVRLWIDGQLLLDNWTGHAPTENSGTMDLEAGRRYSLRIEYFEDGGGAQLRLLWSSAHQPRQVIPAARLSSPVDPVFQLPPPLLRLQPLAGGRMRLVIDTEIPADYAIEATTDFREWLKIFQFPGLLGTAEVTDQEAANYSHRFYRAAGGDLDPLMKPLAPVSNPR